MSKADFECDIQKVFSEYCQFTSNQMDKAVKRALYAGAKQLQAKTKENATAGMKTRNNKQWYNGQIITFTDKIEDAVMIGKYNGDFETEQSLTVHVMGNRKKGSGTYRFRFLEKGTKNREAKTYKGKPLKKNRNLKSISGQWWFKNAQQEVFPNLPGIYMGEIQKTVEKINNTKI